MRNTRQIADDSATHQELRSTERLNSLMSVTVCRSPSAADLGRNAGILAQIMAQLASWRSRLASGTDFLRTCIDDQIPLNYSSITL